MIDAWGSKPAGILMGHLKDLGHYEECVRIDQAIGSSFNIQGKYCLAQLPLQELLGTSGQLSLIGLQSAVCFPGSCSASNMDNLLQRVFQQLLGVQLNSNLTLVKESTCKAAERESLDGLTIFAM